MQDQTGESKSKRHYGDTAIEAVPAKKSKSQSSKAKGKASWALSPPVGGWFLPQDPVFSVDEKYLFQAFDTSVCIYATESSLLVNSISTGSRFLTGIALSTSTHDHIYLATSDGIVSLWNWNDNTRIARWDIGINIHQIVARTQPGTTQDFVYCHEIGKRHAISVHALRTKAQASPMESKQIFKTNSTVIGIEVLLHGKVVIAACRSSIFIGKRLHSYKTELQDFEYVWREFQVSNRITTFNAYLRLPQSSARTADPLLEQRDNVDLAIGDDQGVIHLFEDLLSSLVRIEKASKSKSAIDAASDGLNPKRLHWHREAVGSLKWSKDGNYLISGGFETVLVIWQLSTGTQQTLPHLTAAVESIVVSPLGASYAVTLANNSIVILSTTELQAKSNIVGVQSRRVDHEQMPRESSSSEQSFDFAIFAHVPMVIDPKKPTHMLLSVPSSQPRQRRYKPYAPQSYLQTFDIATQQYVSRQALTRNNATDPNTGPERTLILEPNTKFIQASADGEWLATVDEWIPPQPDMGFIEEGVPEFNEEERIFRREVYLKIWRRDEKKASWTLQTRIDAPHLLQGLGISTQLHDLVSDPSQSRFVSIGEDQIVRFWKPKTRRKDGVIVRGADNGEGLVNWSLEHAATLSGRLDILDAGPLPQNALDSRKSLLAFSSDGSVLAVAVSGTSESDTGVLHILDADTGSIRRSVSELDLNNLQCLAIVGHHIVVVTDCIVLWDIVVDELVYCNPLAMPGVERRGGNSLARLVSNERDGTFAVAYPQFQKNIESKSRGARYFKKASTKVSVYDPSNPKPQWTTTIPGVLLSLIAAKDNTGYLALDASASIRRLSPKTSGSQLITPPPELEPPIVAVRMSKVEAEETRDDSAEETALSGNVLRAFEDLLRNAENDKPVVRPEQLQQIFEAGPSHALPPVKELLSSVVELYARKPRADTAA
ncbi:WD40 repeat-like protein [Polyplosphaeria fusca]|uniref:WD40 repeat-like protein n=1 Tax=Polyplosphaeria fusca TaxID=682080 RepID=A0A9P4R7D7_9PLEO|nr:WD40 repeat-like protein [Polyplosphaeria fusca]